MASNKLRTRITYTSEVVDQMSLAEVRKAYSKIRHIAVERFERLRKYGYTDRQAYQKAVLQMAEFPTLDGLGESSIRQLLVDTSRWLRDPMTKAGKVRQRDTALIKTFREMGYDFVNKQNINDFLNFLNEHQEAYQERNFDYHKIAKAYGEMERLNIPRETLERHFNDFMNNLNKIEKIETKENPEANSDAIRKALGLKPKDQIMKERQKMANRKAGSKSRAKIRKGKR